ncbi:nucleotidyltransferase domain-containing protein [bacterium]|nr:nucleotidyltransferase domain-containing protein [bacterium]
MRETFVGRYSDQVLNMLINRIVEEVKPLQIVLFGSAARGEMHADSNLDLMVVMPNGTHRRYTSQRLYQAISGIQMPYEIIVATSEDLQKHKNNQGLIYQTILREGKVLYDA